MPRREMRSIRPTAYIDVAHEAAAQVLIDLNLFSNLDDLLQRINQIEEVRKDDRHFKSMDYESDDSINSDTKYTVVVPDVSHMNTGVFGSAILYSQNKVYYEQSLDQKNLQNLDKNKVRFQDELDED